METITVAGREFTAPVPYSAGHVLTDNEAAALNQTFHENLRNNFAKKAKDGGTQADFDEYASTYSFGARRAGGPRSVGDPVLAEAIRLATADIKAALKAKGRDATKEQIAEAAKNLAPREDKNYMERARVIVDSKKSVPEDLSDLGL